MSTVTLHGVMFFVNKGTRCPECSSPKFTTDKLSRSTGAAPADGVYVLRCAVCGCEWQEVVNE